MKLVILMLFLIPSVYAGTVQQFRRTYTNLRNLNLTECHKSYRFLNENWMDCHFKLPDNKQISPANLPILDHSFQTDQEGVTAEIDIRTFSHSYDEASLETSMWVSVSYRKAGDFHIHSMPKKFYSPEIISDLIKKAFAISDRKGTLTTTLLGVPTKNNWATEIPLKDVYIGVRTVTPKIRECEKTYKVEMSDSWPEEDKPFSQCVVKDGVERQALPLSEQFWSKKLQSYKNSVTQNDVLFTFYNGTYTILVGENGKYDVEVPFVKAESQIDEAIRQLDSHEIAFMIFEDQLNTLQENEKILGKMVWTTSSLVDIASEALPKYLYP